MKNIDLNNYLENLDTHVLIDLIEALNNQSFPDDGIVRKTTIYLYGPEFNIIQAIGLGIPLAVELTKRYSKLQDKNIKLEKEYSDLDDAFNERYTF